MGNPSLEAWQQTRAIGRFIKKGKNAFTKLFSNETHTKRYFRCAQTTKWKQQMDHKINFLAAVS